MRVTNAKCGLRTTILVLLAVALCAGTIGCGSKSTSTSSATPTPSPAPTPSPTPTPNPTATITTLAPNSTTAGGLAFTLTVSGSDFLPASQVEWNGSSRTTTFVSSTELQAQIMAADLAAAGKVSVTVLNPAPGGGSSNAVTFTVPAATIVFQSLRALDGSDALNTNSISNIWVMNPDGSGVAPLTKLTATGSIISFDPVPSPDGSKIAYVSSRALDGNDAVNANFTFNIWVMDADGSNPKPLTRITAGGGGTFSPKWSRDGSKIVFSSLRALDGSDAVNTNFAFNIWVVNADGSGATPLTRLTAAGSSSTSPAFSPDGSKIAFPSQRALDGSDAANTNQFANVWTINLDGSGAAPVTRLTASGIFNFMPAWSPNGDRISVSSSRALDGSDAQNTNGTFNIWIVQADGSSSAPLTKLTAPGASSFLSKWSPDGSKVFFGSRRALDGSDAANTNSTSNIWVANADGSGATPLTRLTQAGSDVGDLP